MLVLLAGNGESGREKYMELTFRHPYNDFTSEESRNYRFRAPRVAGRTVDGNDECCSLIHPVIGSS